MKDQNLNNFELVASDIHVNEISDVIEKATLESKQCDSDRKLKEISFHLENKEGVYNIFKVYRKHTYE